MKGNYGIKKGMVDPNLWSVVRLLDGFAYPIISVKDEMVAEALMDVLLKADEEDKL